MANRFKGEATVQANGSTYTLRCDFNAMCSFEEETGEDALEIFEKFETGDVKLKFMRAMMWAFMQKHHPESTLEEAGDLLSEDAESLMKVIQASSPTADEAGQLGNARKPTKKKAAA